jgi:TonB-linked SusC/RagA family outer membrane protein
MWKKNEGLSFKLKAILLLLYLLPVSQAMIAQVINMTGTVIDENDQAIPGVNIVVQGTTRGISSDVNGKFTITVSSGEILVFSFLGYVTQEVTVGKQIDITVVLQEDIKDLDEVVVVAYGSQKKVSVTGAIATIQTKDLKQSSQANLSAALAGRLPGLTALQSSGMPGNDDVRLYLRGVGTVNGSNPLILIDGVPRENLSTLDPNEVASVSILKDASATAVFGVRGANGVILVTTRRGNAEKPELSISADYSLQSLSTHFDRIHSWEFAELRNQAARNDGVSGANLPFTQYMIDKYRSGEDPVFYPDRDIYHDYFHDYAPQTRFNLNYSGGTGKLDYFVNAGYINQQGLIKTESKDDLGYDPGFKMNRYNFRANIDYNVLNNLKISANIATYLEQINSPSGASNGGNVNDMVATMMRWTWAVPPTWPGRVTAPGYGVPANRVVDNTGYTYYGQLNRNGYKQQTNTQFNSTVGVEWNLDFITKGLSTKVVISYDGLYQTVLTATKGYPSYGFYVAQSADETSHYTVVTSEDQVEESLNLSKGAASRYYMNLQYSLNYVRNFGLHNFTGMALLQRDNWENNNAGLPYNILGISGRLTYNYDQRYLAEFNMGYNGSEQFHKDHRFGFFPAYSVGWVTSNESFLKDNDLITHLKLRLSYGKVGNDKLGSDRFLYRTVVSETGGPYSQLGLNRKIVQGKIGNELLSWEIAEKTNLGIDLQLFRKLSVTFDVFKEQRNNVLLSRNTVPVFQGVALGNLPKVNIGKINNAGYEVEAAYSDRIDNDFSFTVKGNFAYNHNEQIAMDEVILTSDYAYRYRRTGYSIGQYFGYQIDYNNGNGYLNTQEELDWAKAAYQIGTPRLGDFKYKDVNEDGFVDIKDQVPIGYHPIPRISYAFSGNIAWKGLDLSFLLYGIAKSNTTFDWGFFESGNEGFFTNMHKTAWTEEKYINGDKITYPALSMLAGNVSQQSNNFTILDRSFLRLKSVELGYNLPKGIVNRFSINAMRVYVSGNNLWTLSNLPIKTVDPEQVVTWVVPVNKMINFGINITF